MKYATLLLGLAIVLAGLATARADDEKWEGDFRQCHIRKWFSKEALDDLVGWQREPGGRAIIIEPNEIPDILKAIRVIKRCEAFDRCLGDRAVGKVKHCYQNDRRWR